MSTREQEMGLVRPRAAEVFDEDIDLLQALQFAREMHEQPVTATSLAANDEVILPKPTEAEAYFQQRESLVGIERRLATLRELKDLAAPKDIVPIERPIIAPATREAQGARVRDSFITVPPAVTSVPPPSLPPVAALRVPVITPELSVPSTLRPRAFAAHIWTRIKNERPAGRATWAVLITTIGIALPGGLLVGRALISRAHAAVAAEPTTRASTPAAAPDNIPLPATPASASPTPSTSAPPTAAAAASSAHALSYPVDWSLLVRGPRPGHHGKGRAGSKPAASAVSADVPAKAAAPTPSRPADAPAPGNAVGGLGPDQPPP